MFQCYYCEQIFDTKEALYEHVEVHSDVERNREIMKRRTRKETRFSASIKKNRAKVRNNHIQVVI